jgi:hypothetical protein
VLLYLSPKDISALSCTSKQLRGLSDSEYVWRALFRADFMPRPCDFRQLALSPPKFLYKSRLMQRKERLEVISLAAWRPVLWEARETFDFVPRPHSETRSSRSTFGKWSIDRSNHCVSYQQLITFS